MVVVCGGGGGGGHAGLARGAPPPARARASLTCKSCPAGRRTRQRGRLNEGVGVHRVKFVESQSQPPARGARVRACSRPGRRHPPTYALEPQAVVVHERDETHWGGEDGGHEAGDGVKPLLGRRVEHGALPQGRQPHGLGLKHAHVSQLGGGGEGVGGVGGGRGGRDRGVGGGTPRPASREHVCASRLTTAAGAGVSSALLSAASASCVCAHVQAWGVTSCCSPAQAPHRAGTHSRVPLGRRRATPLPRAWTRCTPFQRAAAPHTRVPCCVRACKEVRRWRWGVDGQRDGSAPAGLH